MPLVISYVVVCLKIQIENIHFFIMILIIIKLAGCLNLEH